MTNLRGPRINLAGNRFGMLLVLDEYEYRNGKIYLKCICDCGNEKFVYASKLKDGNTKSCGCYRRRRLNAIPDLDVDVKIYNWTIIKVLDTKKVLCKCTCGLIKEVWITHLSSGKSQSCLKCAQKTGVNSVHFKGVGEIHKTVFSNIARNALGQKVRKSRRYLNFNITIEYIWDLYLNQDRKCKISRLPIYFSKHAKPTKNDPQTASLDRIDSKEGYIEGNVQWVHKDINRMKNIYEQDYFVKLCKYVSENS